MKVGTTSNIALLAIFCATTTTTAHNLHAQQPATDQRLRRTSQGADHHAIHTDIANVIRQTSQAQPDSTGFTCRYDLLYGAYACMYGNGTVSYPLQDPPTVFAAVCYSYPFNEPTPDNCYCAVYLGTADTLASPDANASAHMCSSCYFVQSADDTDGVWSLAFDCSNLLTGDCVGKDENGTCIANDGVYADSGFTCEYKPDRGEYVCPYKNGTESYPLDDPHTALTAYCYSYPFDEPTNYNCYCDIQLGDTTNDPNNTQSCWYCYFVPSDDETDGVWSIAWDCSNLLDGDCVGRHENGTCISHHCPPDGSGTIQVSDTQTEDCQWLADNLNNGYYYLCQFIDVARECPHTCDACSTLPAGECQDQPDSTYMSDMAGYQQCSWLSDNMDRFSYLCDHIYVATFCPVTCNKCDVLQ